MTLGKLDVNELLTGRARLVAHVTRFAGQPIHRLESVAEHSYMTTQYALFIGWYCRALGARVDMEKLLSRAIVHDLDEAVMVDLPRPIKYADPELRQRWHGLCVRTISDMGESLGVPFADAWAEAKDNSLEGHILAIADLISVTAYLIEELRFGNKHLQATLDRNIDYLVEFVRDKGAHARAELKDIVCSTIVLACQELNLPPADERYSFALRRAW